MQGLIDLETHKICIPLNWVLKYRDIRRGAGKEVQKKGIKIKLNKKCCQKSTEKNNAYELIRFKYFICN